MQTTLYNFNIKIPYKVQTTLNEFGVMRNVVWNADVITCRTHYNGLYTSACGTHFVRGLMSKFTPIITCDFDVGAE